MSGSDQVVSQNTAAIAFVNASGLWAGTLHFVEPGDAYWVNNRVHANGSWNYLYNYSGSPAPASIDLPKGNDTGGSTSKIGVSKVKAGNRSARE